MNDIEVLKRFGQMLADAEAKYLTLTFSGEEFLLRKINSQLWAKCDSLREVTVAIAAYAQMCEFGSVPQTCSRDQDCSYKPSLRTSPSPLSMGTKASRAGR